MFKKLFGGATDESDFDDLYSPGYVRKHVEVVRKARAEHGHDLSPLQEGIVSAIALGDPAYDEGAAYQLNDLRATLARGEVWKSENEFRMGSVVYTEIEAQDDGYRVCVTFENQQHIAVCNSMASAYTIGALFGTVVVDTIYVGGTAMRSAGLLED